MKDSITFSQKPISINKDGVLLKLSDIDTNVYIKYVDESFKDSVKTLRIYLHRETSVKISEPFKSIWEPKAKYVPFDYTAFKAETIKNSASIKEPQDNSILFGVNISLLAIATICYIITTFKIKLL